MGSKITPSKIIPREYIESYVEYVVDRFGKYNPIFIVSGDTNFETNEAIEYYLTALDIVKRKAPNSITTMHLMGFMDVARGVYKVTKSRLLYVSVRT